LVRHLGCLRLLFLLHRLAAAGQRTVTAFGNDHFRIAVGALISLTDLVGHESLTSLQRAKYSRVRNKEQGASSEERGAEARNQDESREST
jgi:hypothetical protein